MNKLKALEVLGLAKGSNPSEAEIKKAFKKKAVKLHPDVNKADNAEEQFKEINAAQNYLLNPQPEFQPASTGNPFADFFRNAGPRVQFSVQPIQKNIRITFRDSVLGSRQKLKVDKKSQCHLKKVYGRYTFVGFG